MSSPALPTLLLHQLAPELDLTFLSRGLRAHRGVYYLLEMLCSWTVSEGVHQFSHCPLFHLCILFQRMQCSQWPLLVITGPTQTLGCWALARLGPSLQIVLILRGVKLLLGTPRGVLPLGRYLSLPSLALFLDPIGHLGPKVMALLKKSTCTVNNMVATRSKANSPPCPSEQASPQAGGGRQ